MTALAVTPERGTYVAMWPVLDEDMSLTELQSEALPDLYAQLRARDLTATGLPGFALISEDPISPTGLTLTARVDVTS